MNTYQLTEFYNTYYGKKFKWGEFDCSTFLRDYIKESTGIDYSHLVSFKWESKLQAAKYLRDLNSSYVQIVLENVRHKVVPCIESALVGDIVFVNCDGWQSAGILYHTSRIACVVEDVGAKLVPIQECKVFKIVRVY